MNAERLHALVRALQNEQTQKNTVTHLQNLITALQNLVSQPAPAHQEALSQSIKTMDAALLDSPSDQFSPTWRAILEEIGIQDLLGNQLKESIDLILSTNQLTPAVGLKELQALQSRLQALKTALDQLASGFAYFKIGSEKLDPGQCEIGILIPRAAVNNDLIPFAEELKELAFILNTFSEVATGNRDALPIKTISSSAFLVYLTAHPHFAAAVAIAIERTVSLYKQLLEIRKIRRDLKNYGVPDEQTEGIEQHANSLMKEGTEKVAVEIINTYYSGDDALRKNELTNFVRISLNKIAMKIDQGFNIEVRAELLTKQTPENATDQDDIRTIQSVSPAMQFLKLEGPPLLTLSEPIEETKTPPPAKPSKAKRK